MPRPNVHTSRAITAFLTNAHYEILQLLLSRTARRRRGATYRLRPVCRATSTRAFVTIRFPMRGTRATRPRARRVHRSALREVREADDPDAAGRRLRHSPPSHQDPPPMTDSIFHPPAKPQPQPKGNTMTAILKLVAAPRPSNVITEAPPRAAPEPPLPDENDLEGLILAAAEGRVGVHKRLRPHIHRAVFACVVYREEADRVTDEILGGLHARRRGAPGIGVPRPGRAEVWLGSVAQAFAKLDLFEHAIEEEERAEDVPDE
jgi:hypothetical protein